MEYCETTWREYVGGLRRMKWNIDLEDQEKLDGLMEELDTLVTVATINQGAKQ